MARHFTRIHETGPSEGLDRGILVLVFIIGAAGIILLKLAGASVLLPPLFASLLLVLYAGAAFLIGRIAIEPETIGDNCYYLGFLFTLTSLAVTLWQLADSGSQVETLRDVIAGFGVALASTIVGVFLRVVLMQIRPDITARDRAARLELLSASREFRTALAASAAEVKAFMTEAAQMTAETARNVARAAEEQADAERRRAREEAEAITAILREALNAAAAGVASDIRASVKAPLDAFRAETENLLDATRSVLAKHADVQREALASQQRAITAQASSAERAAEAAGSVASRLETLAERVEGTSRLIGEAGTEARERLSASLAGIEAAVVAARPVLSMTELAERVAASAAALDAAARRLEALASSVEDQVASRIRERVAREDGDIAGRRPPEVRGFARLFGIGAAGGRSG